jgi:hypothetical protein
MGAFMNSATAAISHTPPAPIANKRLGDLGPKQKAWCDEHLPNFHIYRQGADSVIAETEASRRSAGV